MNDTFDLKRFGWVLRKSIFERPALMIGLFGVTLAITLLTYAIVQNMGGVAKGQISSFILGFIIGGSFIGSTVFGYFSSNASGSSYLTLPASHFEKWLSGILITGLIFTVTYLGFFRLIDELFIRNYRNGLDPNSPSYKDMFNSVQLFYFDNGIAKKVYILFVNICGAMLVGSLYFNRVSYIKVALVLCVLVIGTYFLNMFVAMLFFKNLDMAVPFDNIYLRVGGEIGVVDLPGRSETAVHMAALYVIPFILWTTAYFRLKEKEI